MFANPHAVMHAENRGWMADLAMWEDDLTAWDRELAAAAADLARAAAALDGHRRALTGHRTWVRTEVTEIARVERKLGEYEQGGLPAGMVAAVEAHAGRAGRHPAARAAHEQLKRHCHEIAARALELLRTLTARGG